MHPNKAEKTILVDVFTLVAVTEKYGAVPMEGIWRVAAPFFARYGLALFLLPHESLAPAAIEAVERSLKKRIRVFRSVQEVNEVCSTWLSVAVDFPSPLISSPEFRGKAATIIHDTICMGGDFGEAKKQLFITGMKHNSLFIPTTDYARDSFQDIYHLHLPYRYAYYLPNIGCPHGWITPPMQSLNARGEYSHTGRWAFTALHSIYPRKNLHLEAEVASMLGERLVHIGRDFSAECGEDFANSIKALRSSSNVRFFGALPDVEIADALESTKAFICLSREEGFSIPPREALYWGVRELWLSDIPAHREVYGDIPVNWVDLRDVKGSVEFYKANRERAHDIHALQKYVDDHPVHLNKVFKALEFSPKTNQTK